MKRAFLVALATLNLALVGCGRTPTGVMPVATAMRQHAAVIMANGHAHKLGFDLDRYAQQAPTAHVHHLPPHQGITPAKVDLRDGASPVVDQGDLSACTAFAVGKGLREYLQGTRHEANTPLSALFLYYETRKLRGPNAVNADSGATVTDAMKAIATTGIAPETLWPYAQDQYAVAPSAQACQQAGANKLATGVQLAGLDDIKTALSNHQPVVFGMRLYREFENVGANGKLPMPAPGEVPLGGHAVTVMGFDNAKQELIIKNSFGTNWGDHGYFYMPYQYVTPGNVMDIWTAS